MTFLSLILITSLLAFCGLLIWQFWGDLLTLFFWGAIYVPSRKEKIAKMLEFAGPITNKKVIDLGSGDGRLVVALAKSGAQAYGYEINPFLVSQAKKNIIKENLDKKAFVYVKNFWVEDLSSFDVVVIYGMLHVMPVLKKKLKKELKPGAVVISNYFTFPKWKPDKVKDDVYLYINK